MLDSPNRSQNSSNEHEEKSPEISSFNNLPPQVSVIPKHIHRIPNKNSLNSHPLSTPSTPFYSEIPNSSLSATPSILNSDNENLGEHHRNYSFPSSVNLASPMSGDRGISSYSSSSSLGSPTDLGMDSYHYDIELSTLRNQLLIQQRQNAEIIKNLNVKLKEQSDSNHEKNNTIQELESLLDEKNSENIQIKQRFSIINHQYNAEKKRTRIRSDNVERDKRKGKRKIKAQGYALEAIKESNKNLVQNHKNEIKNYELNQEICFEVLKEATRIDERKTPTPILDPWFKLFTIQLFHPGKFFSSMRVMPLCNLYLETLNKDKLNFAKKIFLSLLPLIPTLSNYVVSTYVFDKAEHKFVSYFLFNKLTEIIISKSVPSILVKNDESSVACAINNELRKNSKNDVKSIVNTVTEDNYRLVTSIIPGFISLGYNAYKLYMNINSDIMYTYAILGSTVLLSSTIIYITFCNDEALYASKDISRTDKNTWGSSRQSTFVNMFRARDAMHLSRKLTGLNGSDDEILNHCDEKNNECIYNEYHSKKHMNDLRAYAYIGQAVVFLTYAYLTSDKDKIYEYGMKLAFDVSNILEHIFDPKAANAAMSAEKIITASDKASANLSR